ncbi:hypothetical protein SAMN05444339_108118 [Loktanella atrilutea]|uniref:Uncharacterized protein n=1 Tax=Loktanella atrilutea TaxID=366533 RepID=A0A1M5CW06_LOKAT|nr:hypothetical protein [Loktanella atrilutea]SHF58777.1 hypothetical protein SAMN05444339_108118 [Loktanella atrilutea]
MKNLLLGPVLIVVPVGVVAVGYATLDPASAPTATVAAPTLGDMTPFRTITTDVQTIAATGDLNAAQTRSTDLETAWNDAQSTLWPHDPTAWGNVDGAIDDALTALRAKAPDPAQVDATLASLPTTLADPPGTGAAGGVVQSVSRIATTDANGRPLPCEVMLDQFRTTLAGATLADADRATIDTLQAKGTERCNADDDARADDFFA